MGTIYLFKMTPDGDVLGCSRCGCDVPVAQFREHIAPFDIDHYEDLCELCSNTTRHTEPLHRLLMEALNFIRANDLHAFEGVGRVDEKEDEDG